jgi:hypothetical protein
MNRKGEFFRRSTGPFFWRFGHKLFLTLRAAQMLRVAVVPFSGRDGVMAVRALCIERLMNGFERE